MIIISSQDYKQWLFFQWNPLIAVAEGRWIISVGSASAVPSFLSVVAFE